MNDGPNPQCPCQHQQAETQLQICFLCTDLITRASQEHEESQDGPVGDWGPDDKDRGLPDSTTLALGASAMPTTRLMAPQAATVRSNES
jgi:hypothetical protein